jgi:hypothetical protein
MALITFFPKFHIITVGYHVYSILLAELISQICVSIMLLLPIVNVHQIMRMYGEVDTLLSSFLPFALDEGTTPLWKLPSLPTG